METLILVLIILCLLSYIIIYGRYKIQDKISKLFFYTFTWYWLGCLTLSLFNPYDLYPVTFESYLLLLLNVFGFIVGFSACKCLTEKKIQQHLFYFKFYRITHSFVYFALLCIGIALVSRTFSMYSVILANMGDRSNAILELGAQNKGSMYGILNAMYVPPLFYFTIVIVSLQLIINKKSLLTIPAVIFIVIFSIIGGGRNNIFTFFIS